MILKYLSITSTVKQKRFRSTEQVQSRHEIVDIKVQSRHEIVDIEVQFRINETVGNDLEKRKINAFQKLKRKQTFL